jgi:hypothetical protein
MRFFTLALLCMTAIFAADDPATGTWKIEGDIQGNPVRDLCTLTVADGKITGSCKGDTGTFDVTGEITDKKIVFRHGGEYEGEKLTLTYSGTIDDTGVLKGTVDVQPMDVNGDFTAKKDTPAPAPAQ